MPEIYVIGGANGSGKTTIALQILPHLNTFEYVNADKIAAGISPFNPKSVAIQAGRLMLERLARLSQSKVNFAFETTLAARHYVRFLKDCKSKGYRINLIYLWLPSSELAIIRVNQRVASGGHNIPEDVICRRYERGRRNLVELYLPLCDTWIIYENTSPIPQLIAEKTLNSSAIIYYPDIWNQIHEVRND